MSKEIGKIEIIIRDDGFSLHTEGEESKIFQDKFQKYMDVAKSRVAKHILKIKENKVKPKKEENNSKTELEKKLGLKIPTTEELKNMSEIKRLKSLLKLLDKAIEVELKEK